MSDTTAPGKVNITGEVRGNYTGCKLIHFDEAEHINEFFSADAQKGMVVVGVYPTMRGYLVAYTALLDGDDLEILQAWDRDFKAFRDERLAEKEKLKAEQAAKDAENAAEQRRLAKVGAHAEQHWKPIIELLRKKGSAAGGKEVREARAQELLAAADQLNEAGDAD